MRPASWATSASDMALTRSVAACGVTPWAYRACAVSGKPAKVMLTTSKEAMRRLKYFMVQSLRFGAVPIESSDLPTSTADYKSCQIEQLPDTS